MKPTDNLSQPYDRTKQDSWIETVRSQVNSLRFDIVQIVAHDARVVLIERTEKIRFDNRGQNGLGRPDRLEA